MTRLRPLITGTALAVCFLVGSFFWAGASQMVPQGNGRDASNRPKHDLLITFDGEFSNQGQLVIQIYEDAESFAVRQLPFDECFLKLDLSDEILWEFKDLPAGEYAVAVFHDRNENWRLDRDAKRSPEEMLGYSIVDSASHQFPAFDECKFNLDENRVVKVKLN